MREMQTRDALGRGADVEPIRDLAPYQSAERRTLKADRSNSEWCPVLSLVGRSWSCDNFDVSSNTHLASPKPNSAGSRLDETKCGRGHAHSDRALFSW